MSRKQETKNNTKYVDLLDEDKPIAGQNFVCLSFLSPENILKKKENYYFEQYLKNFDFKKSLEKYTQFMHFISYKYNLDFNNLSSDLHEFADEEKDNLFSTTLEDDYKTYLDNNEEKLEKDFNENYNFQTNTRGIKVRGVFQSQQEAELRCKMLREVDPNHDVYVGQIGMWMPFHPEAYKTGKVEYLEKELNDLMNEKQKNEQVAKVEFEKRVKESKKKAIAENIENAKKSGNKLTQNVDDNGNLIGIENMNTVESNLLLSNKTVASADIQKELFEGDNIVIPSKDKNSDKRQ
jgi:vacuolar-type H+-ATPase subunit I/STV1